MSLDTFVLIANALGVSPDRLLMEQIISTERCASEEIALLHTETDTIKRGETAEVFANGIKNDCAHGCGSA